MRTVVTQLGLDWASQLESIATAAAAIAAIIAGAFAFLAFRSQRRLEAQQNKVIALQVDELRESVLQRRREQVNRVFLELTVSIAVERGGGRIATYSANVINASGLPVYDAVLTTYLDGEPWSAEGSPVSRRSPLLNSAPLGLGGREGFDREIEPASFYANVTFRDQAGRWWRVGPQGAIEDVTSGVAAE